MNSLTSFVRRHLPSSSNAGMETETPSSTNHEIRDHEASLESSRDQSPPRVFPAYDFDLLDPSEKLEEENYSWYSVKDFYPAAIGEIFKSASSTYQVITKLGYGSASTTWLCRDLRKHRYVTLKIFASRQDQTTREVAGLKHINSVLASSQPVEHIGAAHIRTLLDQFGISRPKSSRNNICLVFKPLGMSLADTRKILCDGRIPLDLVKGIVFYLLQSLDFLHRKANLVHGGMSPIQLSHGPFADADWMEPRKTSKKTTLCSPSSRPPS